MARLETPSIDDLRTLLAVAEAGTEIAAGKRLGISQPVVNRRLRKFRRPPALVRTRKGSVELTDRGREALPVIRRTLRFYDDLKHYLAGRRELGNCLAIGTGASASQFYLARAVAGLRRQLPDWEIQTRILRGKQRITAVVDGTLDLALVTHNQVQVDSIARWGCSTPAQLQVEELVQMPLCIIAGTKTPAADMLQPVLAGQSVPVTLLQEIPLVGLDRESGIRQQIEGLLSSMGHRLDFELEAGGWLGIKEFVRQGLCAGLMPLALLSKEETKHFVIRRLPDDLVITHRAVCRQDARGDVLPEVLAVLRKAAGEWRSEVDRRWSGVL